LNILNNTRQILLLIYQLISSNLNYLKNSLDKLNKFRKFSKILILIMRLFLKISGYFKNENSLLYKIFNNRRIKNLIKVINKIIIKLRRIEKNITNLTINKINSINNKLYISQKLINKLVRYKTPSKCLVKIIYKNLLLNHLIYNWKTK
jgi:hypothetical protein